MSYATDFHLFDDHGDSQSGKLHRQLGQTLATSVAFHVLVFLVILSLHVSPIQDRPLASYQIELVDLSEQKPIPSPTPPAPPKKSPKPAPAPAPPPVSKSVPTPPPVEAPPVQVPQERLAESIAGALDQVSLPEAMPIPVPQPSVPAVSPAPEASPTPEEPLNLQAPPDAPHLVNRERPSIGSKSEAPASTKAASLAKSLQQAVESVPVPSSTHRSSVMEPAESKAASPKRSNKKESLSASRNISLPGEAPKLADSTPVAKFSDQPSEKVKRPALSEALQQAVRSVVIPDRKTLQGVKTPPATSPSPHILPTEKPAMPKMVLPPQAPKLATVESPVRPSDQSPPVPATSTPDRDELGTKIAKLTIPDVDVSQPHETLNNTPSNPVKTKTNLKVSGSSPDGNPYWGRVWGKIDQEWVAPPVTVHQGNVLQVLLEFRLERTGTVSHLTIRKTSGNEYYDLAAKRAVLAAAPLPGFPPDMTERQFTLQFQFTVNEQ